MAIVDNAANVPSALPQPDDSGQQIVSPVAPAQNQTPAPAQAPTQNQQPPQQQPSVTTPPVAPSPNQRLHSFVSSVLSGITTSLAGKAPVKYSVDPTTGKLGPDPNQPQDSMGDKVRRIGAAAFTGLGAGAQAGGQKSGLANALAGLGAGASAQTASAQAADKQAKQQGNEDFERQQQKILRMHDIARGNMLMVSTMQHVYQEELDHDPVRKLNQEWASAAEDEDIPVHYMTESEAAALYKKSPQQLLAEHIVMPLGKKVVKDQNGEPVIDAATGLPKFEGQLVAIDGLHEGQLDKVPQSFVDAVKKYAPYSGQGITGLDGLTAEHPMSVQDFTKFHTAIQEGRKAELAGWAEKTPGANAVQDPNDPKGVLQYNPLTQETRPYKGGKPLGAAKEQADITEKEANANKKDNSGEVTPALIYTQNREDKRALLKLQQGSGSDEDRSTIAEAVRKGRMDPSQLSKRSKDYNAILSEADKQEMEETGKHFNIAQAQTDYKFANNPSTQNTLKYLNSLTGEDNKSGNLGELVAQSNKINRTSFPPLNDAEAWGKLNLAGDPQMAAYYATVTEVADQVAKILQGGGSGSGTSDAKLVQAQALFNQKFTKPQVEGVATTLRTLLGNRKKEMIGNNRYLREQFGSPASSSVTGQQPTTQSGQSVAPDPKIHVFNATAWATANPGKDVNAAIAAAKAQGLQVKQ